VARLDSIIQRPNTELLDDSPYRRTCLEALTEGTGKRWRVASLVDAVILAILRDSNVRIDAMLSFNDRDFGQVCHESGIEYL